MSITSALFLFTVRAIKWYNYQLRFKLCGLFKRIHNRFMRSLKINVAVCFYETSCRSQNTTSSSRDNSVNDIIIYVLDVFANMKTSCKNAKRRQAAAHCGILSLLLERMCFEFRQNTGAETMVRERPPNATKNKATSFRFRLSHPIRSYNNRWQCVFGVVRWLHALLYPFEFLTSSEHSIEIIFNRVANCRSYPARGALLVNAQLWNRSLLAWSLQVLIKPSNMGVSKFRIQNRTYIRFREAVQIWIERVPFIKVQLHSMDKICTMRSCTDHCLWVGG